MPVLFLTLQPALQTSRHPERGSWFGRTPTYLARSDGRGFSASPPYTFAALPGALLPSPGTHGAGLQPAAAREGMETQVQAGPILLPDRRADWELVLVYPLPEGFFLLVLTLVTTDKTEK